MSKEKEVGYVQISAESMKKDYKVREFKVNINFKCFGSLTSKYMEERIKDIVDQNIVSGVFANIYTKTYKIKEVGVK